jgi:hypothetical protein
MVMIMSENATFTHIPHHCRREWQSLGENGGGVELVVTQCFCPRWLLIQGALLSYIVVLVVLVNSENSDPGCKASVIYGRELLLFFF